MRGTRGPGGAYERQARANKTDATVTTAFEFDAMYPPPPTTDVAAKLGTCIVRMTRHDETGVFHTPPNMTRQDLIRWEEWARDEDANQIVVDFEDVLESKYDEDDELPTIPTVYDVMMHAC